MADLYALLGLSRGANGDAIKAAYRRLAKQLHPDVNAASRQGSQPTPTQERPGRTEGNSETIPTDAALLAQEGPGAKPHRWAVHQNARYGFTLKYPADVFTPRSGEFTNNDRLLIAKDGRALLRIFSSPNVAGVAIGKYRAALAAERYAGATFDYAPQREGWFVLSGTVGQEMFYERVTFTCDRRSVHGWLLVYPLSERSFYDAIVEEIHRSYRYDDRPSVRCDEVEAELVGVR